MDLYGKNATAEVGEYFRRSVWGWHPLADYVLDTHPELAAGCAYWHTNDGDGLDAEGATVLAEALHADVAGGRAANYVAERDAELAALPRKTCHICEGRGVRTREDDRRLVPQLVARGQWIVPEGGSTCNGCSGAGTVEDSATHYPLEVADIQEFADFCAASGGFEIC